MKNKVFLVEDDAAIADVYKTVLKDGGIGVEVVGLGSKAISMIKDVQEGKKEKPGIVLLDLILPDINGMEILKAIRRNDKTKDIKVFILSNYNMEDAPGLDNPDNVKPDKFILKTSIAPTQLVKLVKENLK